MSAGLLAVPSAAQAATKQWHPSAITGATFIKALGGTVSSDLTAWSGTSGGGEQVSTNSTAAGSVTGLATVGAAETRTTSSLSAAGDLKVTSYSRIAGVNLLDGLIKVDAVESNITTVGKPDGSSSAGGGTQLAGIHIVGVDLPIRIPKNFFVNIPGVAAVSLNVLQHGDHNGTATTLGWGLSVQLLEARGGFDAGTTIMLGPLHHSLASADYGQPSLAGYAFSTRVRADVGKDVAVNSDPTALVNTPFSGSHGIELVNSTASVNIPQVLTAGMVKSTSTSRTANTGEAIIRNTNEVAGVNLLGGLITADAVKVTASGHLSNGIWNHSEDMELVNLVVAGRKIPIDVGPNTAIDIAGLGRVVINGQGVASDAMFNAIVGLRITLDTARAGLPVGAVIELASAATRISP